MNDISVLKIGAIRKSSQSEVRVHRVVINILATICSLAMLPPFIYLANTKETSGVILLPKFLFWIFGWGISLVILLIALYLLDVKYEKNK